MDFRSAKGALIDWIDADLQNGFSNFLFVDQNYGSNTVLRRIFSLARKHKYISLLIEAINITDCELLVQIDRTLGARFPNFVKSQVHRLSFFRCAAGATPKADDFIGYAVFKRDYYFDKAIPRDHVFESVLPPFRQASQNNFSHCQRDYSIATSVGTFSVRGILYAQQNDATFVCAHVALRTMLACVLPSGDITYPDIDRLAGHDLYAQPPGVKCAGLGPDEIEKVIDGLGLHKDKVVHEPNQGLTLPREFQHELYGFIESGMPALVGFEFDGHNNPTSPAPRHIIPVFGHTFNEDTWLPEAQRGYFGGTLRYYPSENWLSTFLVHDDNFGPYLCLPRSFLKKDYFRLILGLRRVPSQISATTAEGIGYGFFKAIATEWVRLGNDWYDRFSVFARAGWLILRTTLIARSEYRHHLGSLRDLKGGTLDPAQTQQFVDGLPEHFWMIEASALELFAASRRKFGELLFPCDVPVPNTIDESFLLGGRLPGSILKREKDAGLHLVESNLLGHTDLYSIK